MTASGPAVRFPNVVLIGARASGKSRASRRLAKRTGWTRVSTDELLEARVGPIPEFVAQFGWERFREEESTVLRGLTGERLIVDCGGGMVETPQNLSRLRELGTVYWVRAPAAVLRERLSRPKHAKRRPALVGGVPPAEGSGARAGTPYPALPGSCGSGRLEHRLGPGGDRGSGRDAAGRPFRPASRPGRDRRRRIRSARGARRRGRGERAAGSDRAAARRSRNTRDGRARPDLCGPSGIAPCTDDRNRPAGERGRPLRRKRGRAPPPPGRGGTARRGLPGTSSSRRSGRAAAPPPAGCAGPRRMPGWSRRSTIRTAYRRTSKGFRAGWPRCNRPSPRWRSPLPAGATCSGSMR